MIWRYTKLKRPLLVNQVTGELYIGNYYQILQLFRPSAFVELAASTANSTKYTLDSSCKIWYKLTNFIAAWHVSKI